VTALSFANIPADWQARSRECIPQLPSIADSGAEGTDINSILITPLLAWFCDAVDSVKSIAARIEHLLMRCCPSTIFRRIITIIVNTFKASALEWNFAHIREKVRKIVPTITKLYAAPTVVFICRIIRVITAIENRPPALIQRMIREPVFVSLFHPVIMTVRMNYCKEV
jgi:hypothetical protein